MAQTTSAIPQGKMIVEVSTDGSSWTDISGSSAQVTPSGGDQLTGSQNTAGGSAPVVVGSNKTEAAEADVKILYTETSGEAFRVVKARFDGSNKTIYFRYTPSGSGTGNKRYLAADDANSAFACPIQSCMPPDLDSGSGDPAMASFHIIFPKWYEETLS